MGSAAVAVDSAVRADLEPAQLVLVRHAYVRISVIIQCWVSEDLKRSLTEEGHRD